MTLFDAWFAAGIRVAIALSLVTVVRCIRPVFDRSFQARTVFVICLFGLMTGFCWFRLPVARPGFVLLDQPVASQSTPKEVVEQSPVASRVRVASDSKTTETDQVATAQAPASMHEPATEKSIDRAERANTEKVNSQPGNGPIFATLPRLSFWCFLVWSIGVVGIAAKLLMHTVRLQRQLISRECDVSQSLAALMKSLPEQLPTVDSALQRVHRCTRVRISSACGAPLLVGVWRPAIWLPTWIDSLKPQRQQAVILHELAHVARTKDSQVVIQNSGP